MVSKYQLAKHQDYVAAIGAIALEVVDLELELELSILLARTLIVTPKVGEAIYMTAKGDRAGYRAGDPLRDRADPAALSRSLFAVEVLLTSEPRQAIRGRMFRKA